MNIAYDITSLRKFLKNIHSLTSARCSIVDADFNEVLTYPEKCEFCTDIRHDDVINYACKQCDISACQYSSKAQRAFHYTCHMGLSESAFPLIVDSKIEGYMIIGQVIDENYISQSKETAKKTLSLYGKDFENFKEKYDCISIIDISKISSVIKVMQMSSMYLYFGEKERKQRNPIANEIEQYILDNISSQLSVKSISDTFKISPSTLQKLFEESFHMSFAKYVREMKIKKAKELLRTTPLQISEVADKVGIFDYNYFTKIFKKLVGVSPRVYRRQN